MEYLPCRARWYRLNEMTGGDDVVGDMRNGKGLGMVMVVILRC